MRTGALSPYRVVDLTTERGWLCGKILADLGADVIKVEPPGGDPGRLRGPFAGDRADPEACLRWWFANRGKRSVVIDVARERDTLRALIASADVVLESFDPGHLDALGAGYDAMAHESLVWTTITPFGQDGPRANWQGPDLVLAALGGIVNLHGEPDRAPVRVSVPQCELHGAAEAAAATTFALCHAASTGEGQRVDVATQLAVIRTLMTGPAYASVEGRELPRTGGVNANGLRIIYRCLDGYATVMPAPAFGARKMLAWAAKQVEVPEWLATFDWEGTDFVDAVRGDNAGELWEAIGEILTRFCATKTRQELYDEALREGYLIAPVNSVADVRSDEQLGWRGFYGHVEGIVHPGAWALLSGTPLVRLRRAPSIGEHDDEVRIGLGFTGSGPHRPVEDGGAPLRSVPPIPPRKSGGRADVSAAIFEGLRVLDMSWVGVGPMTARYLADHGATVIRLESTKKNDVLRALPPFAGRKPGLNRSQFFADFNASKLGVGVNMSHLLGREVAHKLAAWADVVLQSFTPGTMETWGLSYDQLRCVNRSVVMLSTCMQGQTGPRAHYRGFGQLIASLSGFYDVNGWPDRSPSPVGAYTDTVCQRFAAAALAAALDHRRRTGEGQHIDLSQYETGLQFLGTELLDYEVNGRVATRAGNTDPDACPHGVYPAAGKDRWVAIAVHTDEQWTSLCRIASLPDDPSFGTLAGRKAREPEIDALVARWTASRDPHEIADLLQPDVPAGVVQTLGELHTDPQVVHLGYFVELDHAEIGRAPYEDQQARLSRTSGRVRKAAPCLGEDTFMVLTEILGMSDDEVGDLLAAEAVEIS